MAAQAGNDDAAAGRRRAAHVSLAKPCHSAVGNRDRLNLSLLATDPAGQRQPAPALQLSSGNGRSPAQGGCPASAAGASLGHRVSSISPHLVFPMTLITSVLPLGSERLMAPLTAASSSGLSSRTPLIPALRAAFFVRALSVAFMLSFPC